MPPPRAVRVGMVGEAEGAGAALERLKSLVADAPAWRMLDRGLAADVVARHCDVLVVGGDPAPMATTIEDAIGVGAAVLVVGGTVRLLTKRHWRVARQVVEGEAAWARLAGILEAMLAAPHLPASVRDLHAGSRLRRFALWRTYRWVMNLLGRSRGGGGMPGAPTGYWLDLHEAADGLAGDFADRYRSSYVIVTVLAALALIAAVMGDSHLTPEMPTSVVEIVALLAIAALVWLNLRLAWRPRLIAFRLLAELCRKQSALALVGRSLPASRIARMTAGGDLAWVGWCFAGYVRGAPWPAGPLEGGALAAARDAAAAILLRGQAAYHEGRIEASRMRERRLVWLGNAAFVLTVVCVAAKLALLEVGEDYAAPAGVAAALLPVIAAAFFGLRAYSEFELLVRQSERTLATIADSERNLQDIDVDAPMASAYVGDVLEATAGEMLSEVEGWMELSSVKAVEAG